MRGGAILREMAHHAHEQSELKKMVAHVRYEWGMLFHSLRESLRLQPQRDANVESGRAFNLALEGFLLHFRNLAEFYSKKEKTRNFETDLFAWEYRKVREAKRYGESVKLNEFVDALSPRIAHLTTVRPLRKEYPLLQMTKSLMDAYNAWFEDLDPAWAEDFRDMAKADDDLAEEAGVFSNRYMPGMTSTTTSDTLTALLPKLTPFDSLGNDKE